MKIAIYARYSSDMQNPSSIDDQVFNCHKLIKEKFKISSKNVLIFKDAATSGETIINRTGFENLIMHVRAKQVDIVVAEGLDRISRSLTDTSHAFDVFNFYKTKIITIQEGEISQLHIGLKGTMNALFLKDLKTKIKRGHSAKIRDGYVMSRPAYGYELVRGVVDERNRNVNGVRKINPEKAKIVKRIFEEYATGKSVSKIAEDLNNDNISAPRGKRWTYCTLLGKRATREGILRNELYIGNIVFSKKSEEIDPETKKKHKQTNVPENWVRGQAPELRIIDDKLWQKVRERDDNTKRVFRNHAKKLKKKLQKNDLRHNQSALTGFVFCGVCGGQKSRGKFTRYICDNNRYHHTCKNGRSANEEKILNALKKLLLKQYRYIEFRPLIEESTKENQKFLDIMNRQTESLEKRLNKLVGGYEIGLNGCLTKAKKIQEELYNLKQAKKKFVTPPLLDENAIRLKLLKSIRKTFNLKDRKNLRNLLRAFVSKIILTPKEDKKIGEDIEIFLLKEGWINYWKSINKK